MIVGAGLSGAVFAAEAVKRGKSCLVLEKRGHIGGNLYCEERDGINLHMYGAHIFHTNSREAWDYVNRYVTFNHFRNAPMANYRGQLYNLPFNMNTFNRMWGVNTPNEARAIIDRQRREIDHAPRNLEEQAICMAGRDIYEMFIKGYTEKQWGRECASLPAFIIKRIPVRFTYDNNYFSDPWQGIPEHGYNELINKLLAGCDVRLGVDYNENREQYRPLAEKLVYTGMLDAYFDFCFGDLEYRSLRFEHERLPVDNYQGVAVMNFTDAETPYTRIIEHKHFEFSESPVTHITREYPLTRQSDGEPYYPVNDDRNQTLYTEYKKLAEREQNAVFLGRLAEYRYYNMDEALLSALRAAEKEFS